MARGNLPMSDFSDFQLTILLILAVLFGGC